MKDVIWIIIFATFSLGLLGIAIALICDVFEIPKKIGKRRKDKNAKS